MRYWSLAAEYFSIEIGDDLKKWPSKAEKPTKKFIH